MRIVITGAGGFLGGNLIDGILRTTDYEVVAITSQTGRLADQYIAYEGRVHTVLATEIARIAWGRNDLLLNCAFPMKADAAQMACGLRFIAKVISLAADNGVSAVINISSQSVYSTARIEPATEQTEVCPENQYALGKYVTELFTNHICNMKTAHTNIRLASLIGLGLEQRIINKLITQAIEGRRLHIIGGAQKFGFLDIRDAVEGILKLIDSKPSQWQEVYNLGSNESYTLEEIAQCICSLSTGYCANVAAYELEPSNIKKNSALNCRVFQRDFDWMPRYNLSNMVEYIFENKQSGKEE